MTTNSSPSYQRQVSCLLMLFFSYYHTNICIAHQLYAKTDYDGKSGNDLGSGGFFARVFVPNTTLLKKYFYLRIISVPLKYDVSHYSGHPIITTVIVAKF